VSRRSRPPARCDALARWPDALPVPLGLNIEAIEVGAETLVVFTFPRASSRSRALTRAETVTVALILEGLTTAEIAVRRGVATTTVSSQLQSIYRKLGVSSRTELASRLGLSSK